MKAKIKSVQIISATEVGELYEVGKNGITDIKLFINQVNQYEYNPIYRIFKGESIYAEVAHNCPIEIKYDLPTMQKGEID